MRKNFLLLMSGVVVVGLLLYFLSPVSNSDDPTEVEVVTQEVAPEPVETPVEPSLPAPPPEPKPKVKPPPPEPTGPSEAVQQAFAQHLRELGKCLETTNNVPGDELEPNLRTLVDSVRGEWGEAVISTEDWMQVEMETPEGERRRLRVEMDFDTDSQVQRRLKYMTVDPSGQTNSISMPEDQAIEPSESLIASLELGNRILSREKFERIYFQNGEEIVARQMDGLLVDVEINKGPRTYRCTKLNDESGSCTCIQ